MSDTDLAALVGVAVEEARRRVTAAGFAFRVLSEDGVSHPATADLRDDRVNVAVRGGKVEAVDIG